MVTCYTRRPLHSMLIGSRRYSQQEDGSYVFAFPMAVDRKLSLLHAAADYGAYVRGAIESNVPVGGEVLACGDELTPVELAERWGQGEQRLTRPAINSGSCVAYTLFSV